MRERTLVEALVALATRDGLGDPVEWLDVRAATTALIEDAVGPRDLRAVMARLNDPEVALTLTEWFNRAADEREADAKGAARGAEKLLQPLQTLSFGVGISGAVSFATGAMSTAIALPVALCGIVVGAAATYGRWRLSKRADEALHDAAATRRLAEISGKYTD